MATDRSSNSSDASTQPPGKRRPGRPSRLTDTEALERFYAAVGLGLPVAEATKFAGIGRSTVNEWLALGHDAREMSLVGVEPDQRHQASLEFLDRLEQEIAASIVRNLAIITKAAKNGSWRAAVWLLEQTHPELYGKNRGSETSSGSATTPPDRVSLDDLEATIQRIIEQRDRP